VRLDRLRLENLRNLVALDVEFAPGLNLIVGPNGAGKTSILEGAYLLSHARSFRTGLADTVIRRGSERLILSAQISRHSGSTRLALARSASSWEAKLNGLPAPSLGNVLRECAVVCFEPGSHALISGGSSERRRFLDWGVFHVEPEFLTHARQYSRVLRQRNAALKQNADDAELTAWDEALTAAGMPLADLRIAYFERFSTELANVLGLLVPELGEPGVEFDAGWPQEMGLADALADSRGRDRARGHSTRGPHRADWSIRFEHAPQREHLSRGQEKLCALACVLAQAQVYATTRGEWPVIALDDLASELDDAHQKLAVRLLVAADAQVLISGIQVPECLRDGSRPIRVFHVEHGEVRILL
jgi:DNA replication and repair protein RecF